VVVPAEIRIVVGVCELHAPHALRFDLEWQAHDGESGASGCTLTGCGESMGCCPGVALADSLDPRLLTVSPSGWEAIKEGADMGMLS
jgi:hypothetical protein